MKNLVKFFLTVILQYHSPDDDDDIFAGAASAPYAFLSLQTEKKFLSWW